MRSQDESARVAIHESGHAIVALALGFPVGLVTIVESDGTGGHVALALPPTGDSPQARPGAGVTALARLAAIAYREAGAAAERVAFGNGGGFTAEQDDALSDDAAGEVSRELGVPSATWRPVLAQTLDSYLRQRWDAVLRVSHGLLREHSLSGEDARRLAGRLAPLDLSPVAEAIRAAAGVAME